jgi:single-stranded-DNA-specific exonuclease
MHNRWLINRTNPEYVRYLSRLASISPVFAQVLISRGLKTAADINDFLCPGVTHFSDPYEISSMRTAVERVKAALQRKERILVHGDYDTDGLTATAIMLQALRTIGLDAHYFIPNRILHGYGFHNPGVDMAKKLGASLIITVDCGITSLETVSCANKAGIDVIITDHHEPLPSKEQRAKSKEEEGPSITHHPLPITHHPFEVPDAVAVVNPKLAT